MKNAVLIVLAFALGGGAVWFFTRDMRRPALPPAGSRERKRAAGPAVSAAASARPKPPARRGRHRQARASLRCRRSARHLASERIRHDHGESHGHGSPRELRGWRLRRGRLRARRAHESRGRSVTRRSARESRRRVESASPARRHRGRGLGAESELDLARSRAAAQEARLNTVVARLRDRADQAPFSGLLGFREVSPGTLVSAEYADHVDRRHLRRSSSTSPFPKRFSTR